MPLLKHHSLLSRPVRDVVLSLLLFALFAEWLLPLYVLEEQTHLYEITPLFVALGCFLMIGCLRLHWALSSLLCALVCICVMMFVYGRGGSGLDALVQLGESIRTDAVHILQGLRGGMGVSGELRTLLLLIGWAMLTSSVQILALQRNSGVLFVTITVGYLLVLQWGFGMNTTAGLIRVVAEGLFLMALLHAGSLEQAHPSAARAKQGYVAGWPGLWIASAFGMVLLCILAGWLMTGRAASDRLEPIAWGKGLASLQEWAEGQLGMNLTALKSNRTEISAEQLRDVSLAWANTGYGMDDTLLGKKLAPDSTVVFEATTPVAAYWRGESKSFYDGRGWSEPDMKWDAVDMAGRMAEMSPASDDSWSKPIKQTIRYTAVMSGELNNWPLFAGRRLERVEKLYFAKDREENAVTTAAIGHAKETGMIEMNETSEAVRMQAGAGQGQLLGYDVQVRLPEWSSEQLRQIGGEDPKSIQVANLQLPGSLPSRVSNLAGQIISAAGADNRYNKVKAIEQYLRSHYPYSLDNTSVPPEKVDFVDHFLFTQKSGYCNHFSTAMVVMLRTQGIPARWVKGFAPGEADSNRPDTYTVRMKDAHAWVEVYFPGAGWISFDPTPSYAIAPAEDGQGAQHSAAVAGSSVTAATLPELPGSETPGNMFAGWMGSIRRFFNEINLGSFKAMDQWIVSYGAWALGAAAAFIFMLLGVKLIKRYWLDMQLWLAVWRYRQSNQDYGRLVHIAALIWRKWSVQYGEKPPEQTMREYTIELADKMNEDHNRLMQFVYDLEQIMFHPGPCDRVTKHRFINFCQRQIGINR